ncbi:Translocon-associated protein subunit beta [Bienertia sinuspersici]
MAISIHGSAFMIVVFASLMLASSALANSNSPFIVAHKKATLTKLRNGVERISVSIDLYNRGSVTVYDVSLVDKSWPMESFDVISGNFSRAWESLDVGAIVSHSIELEPRVKGHFQGSPAVITFRIPNKAEPVVAYSTPIFPLNMLIDSVPENKLELTLLARFGPQFSAISIVALFGYVLASPSKSNGAKALKKRR